MTKLEAIAAMENGALITHIYFAGEEYMKAGVTLDIEFEDGCGCSYAEFWACRTDAIYHTGWSIFKGVNK